MLAALACWRSGVWPLLPLALVLIALPLRRMVRRLGDPAPPEDRPENHPGYARASHGRLPPMAGSGAGHTGAGN
ncbi:hypothetical protein [Frigidibacter mobilis]|nr:hypothetical protein [Frigidibacter mobilis]